MVGFVETDASVCGKSRNPGNTLQIKSVLFCKKQNYLYIISIADGVTWDRV